MATLTFSCYTKEPKRLHSGLNTVSGTLLVTATAGSIIKFCKLPDRAQVVNAGLWKAAAQGDLAMGISGDADLFVDSVSASGLAAINATDGLNYQVSLSDDVIVKELDVQIAVSSAGAYGIPRKFALFPNLSRQCASVLSQPASTSNVAPVGSRGNGARSASGCPLVDQRTPTRMPASTPVVNVSCPSAKWPSGNASATVGARKMPP